MACNQTLSGIPRDCEPSIGGLRRLLLANRDDVTAITISDDQVSAITMKNTAKFKEYVFPEETASATSTYQINKQNGSKYVQTDIVLVFTRMETAKRVEITALAQNDMIGIGEDMNGKYWLYGQDHPISASAGDGGTGAARSDRNGYGITLQDNSKTMPPEVDGSIIGGLL